MLALLESKKLPADRELGLWLLLARVGGPQELGRVLDRAAMKELSDVSRDQLISTIEETVRHYFRSGDENDAAELETAFHPRLGMYWVGKDGNVQALDRQAWAERLRSARARQPARVRRTGRGGE